MVKLGERLGSEIVAEGIETVEEYAELRACGVELMQGYLFARPPFEALPRRTLPEAAPKPALVT